MNITKFNKIDELYNSIEVGDLETITTILTENYLDLNNIKIIKDNNTPLTYAIKTDMETIEIKLKILRVLVLHGADVNYEINTVDSDDSDDSDDSVDSFDSDDYKIIKIINPILSIIDRRTDKELDKIEILKFLLDKGADINKYNNLGQTILNIAIQCNNFHIVDFILHKTKIDLLHRYKNCSYLMYIMNNYSNRIHKNYRKCINYIINKHPNEIHYKTPNKIDLISVIFRNYRYLDIETLEQIIFLGIDLNYCNKQGFNALMKACNNIYSGRRKLKRNIEYAISILINPQKIDPPEIRKIRSQFNILPSFISPNFNETPKKKKKRLEYLSKNSKSSFLIILLRKNIYNQKILLFLLDILEENTFTTEFLNHIDQFGETIIINLLKNVNIFDYKLFQPTIRVLKKLHSFGLKFYDERNRETSTFLISCKRFNYDNISFIIKNTLREGIKLEKILGFTTKNGCCLHYLLSNSSKIIIIENILNKLLKKMKPELIIKLINTTDKQKRTPLFVLLNKLQYFCLGKNKIGSGKDKINLLKGETIKRLIVKLLENGSKINIIDTRGNSMFNICNSLLSDIDEKINYIQNPIQRNDNSNVTNSNVTNSSNNNNNNNNTSPRTKKKNRYISNLEEKRKFVESILNLLEEYSTTLKPNYKLSIFPKEKMSLHLSRINSCVLITLLVGLRISNFNLGVFENLKNAELQLALPTLPEEIIIYIFKFIDINEIGRQDSLKEIEYGNNSNSSINSNSNTIFSISSNINTSEENEENEDNVDNVDNEWINPYNINNSNMEVNPNLFNGGARRESSKSSSKININPKLLKLISEILENKKNPESVIGLDTMELNKITSIFNFGDPNYLLSNDTVFDLKKLEKEIAGKIGLITIVPKKTAPKKTSTKKTAPKKTSTKKTVPKKTSTKKTVPKKTVSKKKFINMKESRNRLLKKRTLTLRQ